MYKSSLSKFYLTTGIGIKEEDGSLEYGLEHPIMEDCRGIEANQKEQASSQKIQENTE